MAGVVPLPRRQDGSDALPVLHLSGPKLAAALERLVAASEPVGGIEILVEALRHKTALFQKTLEEAGSGRLTLEAFELLCAFMPTCRRRIAGPLNALGFAHFRAAIAALLDDVGDTSSTDARLARFVAAFPRDRQHRFVRDLAAELLHHAHPELYPLMTRWVWDNATNTGVLREIWHGENVDHMVIDIPDGYATFLALRAELCQFLSDNGVFRDVLVYSDLLQAQIYADYISAQGGAYLRTDFVSALDPLEHTRRILGLDGLRRGGRTRFKTIDGAARVIDDLERLR